jgi:hypothetical protein
MQRKPIDVLVHGQRRQHPRSRRCTLDDALLGNGRALELAAARLARDLLAQVLDHLDLRRHELDHQAALASDRRALLAAIRTRSLLARHIERDLLRGRERPALLRLASRLRRRLCLRLLRRSARLRCGRIRARGRDLGDRLEQIGEQSELIVRDLLASAAEGMLAQQRDLVGLLLDSLLALRQQRERHLEQRLFALARREGLEHIAKMHEIQTLARRLGLARCVARHSC